MNINYDEIITKANQRKDALKALSKALKEVDMQATVLYDALSYFENLGVLMKAVDQEGRNMLGDIALAVHYCVLSTSSHKDQLFGPVGIKERRVTWLRSCLETV